MSDPYKILGVSPYASDDEITKAYKKLAKKYHPDNYTDNPLADLATEKMQEINQAYDEIRRTRRENGSHNNAGYQGYTGYSNQSQGNVKYNDVRIMIQQGRIADADQILSGVPSHMRDAEWYFLKGTVFYHLIQIDTNTYGCTVLRAVACILTVGTVHWTTEFLREIVQVIISVQTCNIHTHSGTIFLRYKTL